MENYPYWAYAAVPGSLDEARERAALDEGRRLTALTLALREPDIDEGHVARALKFEAYLKGEAVGYVLVEEDELQSLIARSDRLLELEREGRA